MSLDNKVNDVCQTNGVNLSLWLPLGLMAVSLIGIVVIYLLIKRKIIENEGIDKIIDLVKWFVVSVGIVLITLVVNDGFRAREQTMKEMEQKNELLLKEMEFFAKYTETVLDASGDEKREKLSEYFEAVSPEEGHMKVAWKTYKEIVSNHIKELNNQSQSQSPRIKELEKKLHEKKITAEERVELLDWYAKKQSASQSLTSPSQEWAIIAGSDATPEKAEPEVDRIKKAQYPVYMYKKDGRYRTVVKPFSSRDEALNTLQDIMTKAKGSRKDSYIVNFQGWCTNPETKIEDKYTYTECK
ncbi:MAG: SPOR domain-containing protein [Methylococcales bacterium]